MKNINSYRVFEKNTKPIQEDGKYVLYWMQSSRRFHYHFGLEYAVAWANKLKLPLLIYEGLNAKYPWNSERTTQFILEGMAEHEQEAQKTDLTYISFAENQEGKGKGIVYKLADSAALLISDEYPVYINKSLNERVKDKVTCRFICVDSNGVVPLGLSDKAPYSAYLFRKVMQKYFGQSYENFPKKNPLDKLENKAELKDLVSDESLLDIIYRTKENLTDIPTFISTMQFDHEVSSLQIQGTRVEGLKVMNHFLHRKLRRYHTHRNHPDTPTASQLSPWLHFGKVSVFEVVQAVIQENKDWDVSKLTPNNGKNVGYFNLNEASESFLDEIITWREVGFHFAHHTPNYDAFDSLPDWALQTMDEHRADERKYIYSFDELKDAKTHDPIWNAAQRQLEDEGIIHNYLRMLWGKKVIEWSRDYETALNTLIELNNIYAIDGRDPNSYSGIFWCFGRFDRAWTERPIFGKLRYMASANTEKKIKMKGYLKKWGNEKDLF